MKKPKPPSLVTLAIMTTITVVLWVFFSVYRVYMTKLPTNVPPEILNPISPTLDIKTLAQIEQKVYFEKGEIEAFLGQPELVLPAVETKKLSATPSSELGGTTKVSESTESGELRQ